MKHTLLIFIICLIEILNTCQTQESKQGEPSTSPVLNKKVNPYANMRISYQLIPSESNTWGYDIFVDGSKIIHQPSRPALPGNSGFDTKEKAQKIANLVIEKIKKGEMPPTISTEEMQKAGVL